MLTTDQYAKNVATKPGSSERVEFAIRLPGRSRDDQPVWLPIDAKFPREDYERLLEAEDRADPVAAEAAAKQLEIRIRDEAKKIHEKYIAPPDTTDFGLLFLPIEGLYAEVLRRPGLTDRLQREYRVTVTGPTTLAATLNSLQMGFRTLAIEKRSSEVWQVLGAVKTEFGKFGELLARTKKQLDTVSSTLGDAESKTRTIERKLRNVEQLSDPQARVLLGDSTDSGDA
jgi:DNA recombination protein RmuC